MISLHPLAKRRLDILRDDLPQSLLLSGRSGVGLLTIAQWLAENKLGGHIRPKSAKGEYSDNGTISVESIRQLYEQTRSKRSGQLVFIIDDADRMSHAAQSAFLKLLEEPNHSIHFIVTSHYPDALLPTIRSRLQHTSIPQITSDASNDFIASFGDIDTKKRVQLLYIAEGLPAELSRLINDDAYFSDRARIITDARDLLRGNAYEKTLVIHNYRSDREAAMLLVDSALKMLRKSISDKPQPALITQLERLHEAGERLAANGNIPLQLMRFVL